MAFNDYQVNKNVLQWVFLTNVYFELVYEFEFKLKIEFEIQLRIEFEFE